MPTKAQLSPGELSQAHTSLDGNSQCAQCHTSSEGVAAELCLNCHTLLGERIDANLGLHAQPGYETCQTCHIEHHGWQFELVWWGEGGEASFDHQLTGEPLEGAHAELGCRECHQAEFLVEPALLRGAGKDLDRTFLGLDPACLACHADEHREQFAADSCRSCHELDAWSPAPLFDHDQASFPLTGRHVDVDCAECHPTVRVEPDRELESSTMVQYLGIAAETCVDCHEDPHRGRMGGDCQGCHDTEGWDRVDVSTFDHDRTRFPLRGLHRAVTCEQCHQGPSMQIAGFEHCDTCHADAHFGQFRHRPGDGDCAECHTADGFVPSRFTVKDHEQSDFPLIGSHRQVACADCHQQVLAIQLEAWLTPIPEDPHTQLQQFHFASTQCEDCHRDPHAGDVDAYLGTDGCESCHRISTWDDVEFDHSLTGWALEGRHLEVGCVECHKASHPNPLPEGEGESRCLSGSRGAGGGAPLPGGCEVWAGEGKGERERDLVRLAALPTACESCHQDPHLGQFGATGCDDCHHAGDWEAIDFDHNRDAAFPLEGGHQRVACEGCHPLERRDGTLYVRYKPIPHACSDCHGVTVP